MTELSSAERTMLAYALDQAQEKIWSEDGFTPEDQAAVESLRRLVTEAEPPHPPHDSWLVELLLDDGEWHVAYPTHDRDKALDRLRARRASSPGHKWRLVRMTDSYAVEISEEETR